MATHSSTLAWKIPWTEEPGRLQSVRGVAKSRTRLSDFTFTSVFPSIRVLSDESALCIRWPKYWSFSFSISPSDEYSGLIYFRIDWFDFLAVQGTLKSLLQHHNSKASILCHSAFFMVQLSYLYMTTGKKTYSFDSTDFAVATGLEKASFHSNPRKDNADECSNYLTIVLISYASKGLLKILQSRLQQYVN